jgi:hypothetical protein
VIVADPIGMQLCLQHACAWEAWIEGPVPLGEAKRLVVHIDCIILPSKEEAVECIWQHLQGICEDSNYPFDPDDWTIMSMKLNNAN